MRTQALPQRHREILSFSKHGAAVADAQSSSPLDTTMFRTMRFRPCAARDTCELPLESAAVVADRSSCPDEGDQCLPNIAVGQPCQKDRDDECQPPSNWRELNGFLNTNGSICLNFTCEYVPSSSLSMVPNTHVLDYRYANATVGQECIIDNTAYATYLDSGGVSTFIISRDKYVQGIVEAQRRR